MENKVTLKHKLIALFIGLVPLATMFTPWALAQENCCNWTEILRISFFAAPVGVALAILAVIVRVLLLRKG